MTHHAGKMTPLPDGLLKSLSADFYGPLPTGEYLIVIIDDYSHFPIVEIVYSTSARVVIPVSDKTFSIFGIPDELKTDNGPPFQGSKFANFAKHMGFKNHKVTPLWSLANGQCERFMRNLGKVVQGARTENKQWKQEFYKFLRNYHATPQSSMGKSPAFARSDISPGDIVLVKQPKHNKTTTPYDISPPLCLYQRKWPPGAAKSATAVPPVNTRNTESENKQ